MATKSFTRTIIISDPKAIEILEAKEESKNSKFSELVNKYSHEANKKVTTQTLDTILNRK